VALKGVFLSEELEIVVKKGLGRPRHLSPSEAGEKSRKN
jgi:hypothetical protein